MSRFERIIGLSDVTEKPSKIQRRLAKVIMIISCVIPVMLPLLVDITQKQYLLKRTTESIMFVTSSVMAAAFFVAFIQFIFILIYSMKFTRNKFQLKKNWRSLCAICLLIILLTAFPFTFMNKRYDLRDDGIYKISTFGGLIQKHPWNKVSEAQVYIDFSVKYGYQFHYDIILENGKRIGLYPDGDSKDIWDSLRRIDYLLWENNVYIDRDRQYIEELEESEGDKMEEFLY